MNYEKILSKVSKCGSNDIDVFGGDFEGGYQLQQHPLEITPFLLDLSKRHYQNYLEIGIAAAGLTRIMCDILNIENVYTIDFGNHESIPLAYDNNISNLENSGNLNQFIGDSHSSEAYEFLESQGVNFDLAFIDGDHSYEGIKLDAELALKFMDTGFIAFHDHACVSDIGKFNIQLRLRQIASLSRLKFYNEYISDDNKEKGIVLYKVTK